MAEIEELGMKSDNPYGNLKLDARGLPLVPQPSDHKDDPLVCGQQAFRPFLGKRIPNPSHRIGPSGTSHTCSFFCVCLLSWFSVRFQPVSFSSQSDSLTELRSRSGNGSSCLWTDCERV